VRVQSIRSFDLKKKLMWVIAGFAGAAVLLGGLFYSDVANAADLGGDCCADLEERIAELEATAAKKSKKTSVVISGRVSQGIVWTDVGDYNDWSVGEMSTAPSYLGVSGAYKMRPGWTAKYALQLGFGGYEGNLLTGGYGHLEGDTHGLYIRNASFSLESDAMGTLTMGKTQQATDGISQLDRTNSWMASTPLSLRPLTGPGVGEALELFDGTRANVVRYDSPTIGGGLWLSGSVAAANTDFAGNSDGTVWDVAARYWGSAGGFDIAAGVGYRQGIWIEDDNLVGVPLGVAISDEPTVISGSGSVKHRATGLFMNATYGNMDVDGLTIDGYSVKGGIERSWLGGKTSSGKGMSMAESNYLTTVFAEYGKWDLGDLPGIDDVSYIGGGVVQAYGPMAFFVSGRQYDMAGEDATVLMAGSTIAF
jgi:predicted porin